MTIQIKKFGEILTSRPEGREAALVLISRELRQSPKIVELDFTGVLVMTPSWLGEFVGTLAENKNLEIQYVHTENSSVKASIEMTLQTSKAANS